jgi:hypothetical protein
VLAVCVIVFFSNVVTFTVGGPTLMAKDVRVIPVYQDKQSFYRCIAVHGSSELLDAKRLPLGYPEDCDLWTFEDDLAAGIKQEVVLLLQSKCENEELQQLCGQLSTTLSRPLRRVDDSLQRRIEEIERNNKDTDILEVLAVSYLTKTQLHVYQRDAAGYRLDAKYPPHAFASRPPIRLLYKPGDQQMGVRESFEVLLLKDGVCLRQWSMQGNSLFDEYAETAAEEDKKISFEKLIIPDNIRRENSSETFSAPSMYFFSLFDVL